MLPPLKRSETRRELPVDTMNPVENNEQIYPVEEVVSTPEVSAESTEEVYAAPDMMAPIVEEDLALFDDDISEIDEDLKRLDEIDNILDL